MNLFFQAQCIRFGSQVNSSRNEKKAPRRETQYKGKCKTTGKGQAGVGEKVEMPPTALTVAHHLPSSALPQQQEVAKE